MFKFSKAPVPIKPWDGIRNAENYGRKCPTLYDLKGLQRNAARNEDLEDCLIMAIFSTKVRPSKDHPKRQNYLNHTEHLH